MTHIAYSDSTGSIRSESISTATAALVRIEELESQGITVTVD